MDNNALINFLKKGVKAQSTSIKFDVPEKSKSKINTLHWPVVIDELDHNNHNSQDDNRQNSESENIEYISESPSEDDQKQKIMRDQNPNTFLNTNHTEAIDQQSESPEVFIFPSAQFLTSRFSSRQNFQTQFQNLCEQKISRKWRLVENVGNTTYFRCRQCPAYISFQNIKDKFGIKKYENVHKHFEKKTTLQNKSACNQYTQKNRKNKMDRYQVQQKEAKPIEMTGQYKRNIDINKKEQEIDIDQEEVEELQTFTYPSTATFYQIFNSQKQFYSDLYRMDPVKFEMFIKKRSYNSLFLQCKFCAAFLDCQIVQGKIKIAKASNQHSHSKSGKVKGRKIQVRCLKILNDGKNQQDESGFIEKSKNRVDPRLAFLNNIQYSQNNLVPSEKINIQKEEKPPQIQKESHQQQFLEDEKNKTTNSDEQSQKQGPRQSSENVLLVNGISQGSNRQRISNKSKSQFQSNVVNSNFYQLKIMSRPCNEKQYYRDLASIEDVKKIKSFIYPPTEFIRQKFENMNHMMQQLFKLGNLDYYNMCTVYQDIKLGTFLYCSECPVVIKFKQDKNGLTAFKVKNFHKHYEKTNKKSQLKSKNEKDNLQSMKQKNKQIQISHKLQDKKINQFTQKNICNKSNEGDLVQKTVEKDKLISDKITNDKKRNFQLFDLKDHKNYSKSKQTTEIRQIQNPQYGILTNKQQQNKTTPSKSKQKKQIIQEIQSQSKVNNLNSSQKNKSQKQQQITNAKQQKLLKKMVSPLSQKGQCLPTNIEQLSSATLEKTIRQASQLKNTQMSIQQRIIQQPYLYTFQNIGAIQINQKHMDLEENISQQKILPFLQRKQQKQFESQKKNFQVQMMHNINQQPISNKKNNKLNFLNKEVQTQSQKNQQQINACHQIFESVRPQSNRKLVQNLLPANLGYQIFVTQLMRQNYEMFGCQDIFIKMQSDCTSSSSQNYSIGFIFGISSNRKQIIIVGLVAGKNLSINLQSIIWNYLLTIKVNYPKRILIASSMKKQLKQELHTIQQVCNVKIMNENELEKGVFSFDLKSAFIHIKDIQEIIQKRLTEFECRKLLKSILQKQNEIGSEIGSDSLSFSSVFNDKRLQFVQSVLSSQILQRFMVNYYRSQSLKHQFLAHSKNVYYFKDNQSMIKAGFDSSNVMSCGCGEYSRTKIPCAHLIYLANKNSMDYQCLIPQRWKIRQNSKECS